MKKNIKNLIIIGLIVIAAISVAQAASNDVKKVIINSNDSWVDGDGSVALNIKTGLFSNGAQTGRGAPHSHLNFQITLESGQVLTHSVDMLGSGLTSQLPGSWINSQSVNFVVDTFASRFPTAHCGYHTTPGNSLFYKQNGDEHGFSWSDGSKDLCGPIRVSNARWLINTSSPNPSQPPQSPSNQSPTWIQTPNQSIVVGQSIQFTIAATDPDSSNLTYSSIILPFGSTFNASSRTFSWTPTSSQIGNHTSTFRVSDGQFLVDMNVIISVSNQNINVTPPPPPPVYQPPIYIYQPPIYQPPVYQPPQIYYSPIYSYNHPPVWQPVPQQYGVVGHVAQFTVLANDPEGNYITYQTTTMPIGASFNSDTRTFIWVPASNQAGTHTAVFIASDGYHSVDMTVSIIVRNEVSITPPVLSCGNASVSNPSAVIKEGEIYTNQISGGTNYRAVNVPYGLVVNASSGFVTWVPDSTQGRSDPYVITVVVSNNCYIELTKVFSIIVEDTNSYNSPVVISLSTVKINDIRITQCNNEVIVSWTTDKPSTSGVIYDTSSKANLTKDFGYAHSTPIDHNLVTEHSMKLEKLRAGNVYYFRVVSQASGESIAVSSESSFTKLAATKWFFVVPLLLLVLLILIITAVVIIRKQTPTQGV